jgi:general secretion pathway protein G
VSSRHERGFTLIELLVVITVLAILASLVSPMVFRNVGDARTTAARSQLDIVALALDTYRLDNDYYPTTEQGLTALVSIPDRPPPPRRWRGPYLKRALPDDPWGRSYVYESADGDSYSLRSLGRDGAPGGAGEDEDIVTGSGTAQ